jgi:hypothetical protein
LFNFSSSYSFAGMGMHRAYRIDPRSSGRHRFAAVRNPHARKTRRASMPLHKINGTAPPNLRPFANS